MALYMFMFVFQDEIALSGLYNDSSYPLTQEEKAFPVHGEFNGWVDY